MRRFRVFCGKEEPLLHRSNSNLDHLKKVLSNLLGVGLFQQGAPELGPLRRVDEQQLPVLHWQAVVDHHFHPLTKLPELHDRKNINQYYNSHDRLLPYMRLGKQLVGQLTRRIPDLVELFLFFFCFSFLWRKLKETFLFKLFTVLSLNTSYIFIQPSVSAKQLCPALAKH